MQRILIAEVKQETATFNPALTLYDDFRIYRGTEIVEKYRGTSTELSGAFDVFDERGGIVVVPTVAADSVSGGYIEAAGLDRLLGEMIDAVRTNADVEGAYICLHGAMAGENEPDPEGRLLAAIREALGDVPIVASLDLHAVLTNRMIESADILVPYHTYPHIDHDETGQRAARCLLKLLDGQAKPATVRVPLPMLVRGDELITATGRFGEAIKMCQALEADDRGLAAGVLIGNAFTDAPALQSNVLVTSDNAAGWAADEASRVARFMWKNRELFQAELTSLTESIEIARATNGLTVFSDAADATASGASGDSNVILKALLGPESTGTALVPIVDAPAVERAFDAGVGRTVDVSLGGTRDAGRFQPLPVTARVKSLHDGVFQYENGTTGNAGRVAVLVVDRVTVMVTERSVYVVGRKVFESHGLDPRDFDVVVVKSPNGFRTWYEEIATRIVPVDVPGSTSANLKSLPFEHCVRPIFPLDEYVEPGFELEES
ncbi:MAG: microcystin degradation protein MlrC [Planctomycetaceae bacterium]|nr:microcystin degradation protein MlrC [Planctomycetaceae bacterium]